MATLNLLPDFKEFLRLLNSNGVEYLLIGGYAVGYYGYARATTDIDVWVAMHQDNADRIVLTLREYGFDVPELSPALFLKDNAIVRMGVPPFRIELLTRISGVSFDEAYQDRVSGTLDGVEVTIISKQYLKLNKRASGRKKDLVDLEHLD